MFFKVILVFGSFIVSLFLVALILKVSRRMGWYDRTGGRKIHSGNIPRLGGLGFTVSFIIFVIIGFSRTGFGFTFQVLPVAAGFVLILISGIRDDFNPLTPRCKLIFQAVAALCVLLSGRIFTRFVYDDVIGCFLAENITENNSITSPLRSRYVKPGGNANDMNALDWEKINFIPDIADPNASRKYTRVLTAGYSNGVLTIKGVLTLL